MNFKQSSAHSILFLVPENISRFINAGGEAIREVGDSSINIMPDDAFDGGDVFRTNESIIDGGDFASFYQSARVGNICYQFENLWTGEYIVDLHFAEIVNTNGPKGMRVFDVFVQEEKVNIVYIINTITIMMLIVLSEYIILSFFMVKMAGRIGS